MTLLTFVIPVRHPSNIRDIKTHKKNLEQTIKSIENQTNRNWQAVIVVNSGFELPKLSKRFIVKHVCFNKNEKHELLDSVDQEDFREAVRLDKGSRILAGMLEIRKTNFFMIVDDDDLVSCRLVDFVSNNLNSNGWKITRGYVWNDGGKILLKKNNFNNICGTSLVIRSDLYRLPNEFKTASFDYIKKNLGSHIMIDKILDENGTPLDILPFYGAIYRVGHVCSHSGNKSIFGYFIKIKDIKNPLVFFKKILRLRLLNDNIKEDFF